MQPLLDKISHSPESELPGLLYGYSQSSAGAQKVLLGMLRPLRAPSSEQHMSVEAVRQSGRFTMIVARVPWSRGTEPAGLQPIIITGDAGHEQVVGYILPFNDIFTLMQGTDMQSITELSQWWIQKYGQKRGVQPRRCSEPPPRFAVGRFGDFVSDCYSRPSVSGGGRYIGR